ncbi:MAG: hypothetical protein HYZ37_05900 [Candidatus Solibacter usitatus]|nr:hypothetical protein [Candidatus Solibacter usitatus]
MEIIHSHGHLIGPPLLFGPKRVPNASRWSPSTVSKGFGFRTALSSAPQQHGSPAFLDVLQAKENVALAQQNLKSLSGIVEINGVRVRSGDLAGVELTRSQVADLLYQNAVQQAKIRMP